MTQYYIDLLCVCVFLLDAVVSTLLLQQNDYAVAKYSFLMRGAHVKGGGKCFSLTFPFSIHTHILSHTHPNLSDPLFSFCSDISSNCCVRGCE